jgi:hypothetical protein
MQFLEENSPIEVHFVPILAFGPPGSGKSTLAQTAEEPLTLDFDKGIHRVSNRKKALRFDTWSENVAAAGPNGAYRYPTGHPQYGQLIPYKTLVIDTGGRALDTMIPEILKENSKNGYAGNLTPQGWGVLGSRFVTWMKTVASWGKQVVFVCHEDEAKNAGGNSYFVPDLPGKMAWKEIHKQFDLIGRINYEGSNRFLDFNPSDNSIGKNAAGWRKMPLPDLLLPENKDFLARLIADARQKIGAVSAASAAIAGGLAEWKNVLLDPATTNLEKLNTIVLGRFKELAPTDPLRVQVWHAMSEFAKDNEWFFDKDTKIFTEKRTK